jgi:hypothetical protein
MADFQSLFGEILDIIDYKGNKEKHVAELEKALQAKVAHAQSEAVNDFFIDYIQAVGPTLQDEQRNKLALFFKQQQDGK